MIFGDLLRALTKVGENIGALEKEAVFADDDGGYHEAVLIRKDLVADNGPDGPIVIYLKPATPRLASSAGAGKKTARKRGKK